MKTSVIIILCLVSACLGGKLRACIETDVCSSIEVNRLVLGTIANDIGELSFNTTLTMLESVEDMKQATKAMADHLSLSKFDTKVLDKCQEKFSGLEATITKLEEEVGSPWARDDALQAEASTLQEEKSVVETEMTTLQNELKELERQMATQQDAINRLLKKINRPIDCADVQASGETQNGVYTVYPFGVEEGMPIYCDLSSGEGAWTVFLKRQQQDDPVSFDRSWEDFKNGFGEFETEFWLGNELLHKMTTGHRPMTLRMDAESFSGDERFAEWNTFSVGDESNAYKLTVGGLQPRSTMGDSITESNNMKFTTSDKDNDIRREFNCATGGEGTPMFGKGGWWYSDCGSTRPTAPLINTNYLNSAYYVMWNAKGGQPVSMKALSMKFRRLDYSHFVEGQPEKC